MFVDKAYFNEFSGGNAGLAKRVFDGLDCFNTKPVVKA